MDATVGIDATVNDQTDVIVMNMSGITINSAHINDVPATIKIDTKESRISLSTGTTYTQNTKIKITFKYTLEIKTTLSGFYRSTYADEDGTSKTMYVTQFEPCSARMMFPCWDEPDFKARFQINVEADAGLVVLSNTCAIETLAMPGNRISHVFEETPTMSTYLVAIIVGDLDYKALKHDRIDMRVYARKSKVEETEFALQVLHKSIEFYEEYFNKKYPLSTMYMVAIPDFSFGAMENWGLVTYRETALLCANDAGILSKKYVASVVAHELAHQWFGNLVTMSWWTDLWLNEGFATWAASLAVDTLFPDWRSLDEFLVAETSSAMSLDSLCLSHPIEVPVSSAEEADQIFDAISYSKGASVIMMLADMLGDTFKKGLRIYINKFEYKNAVSDDLWESLNEASGRNVGEFMSEWTRRAGYPLVSVRRSGNELIMDQKKFGWEGEERWPLVVRVKVLRKGVWTTERADVSDRTWKMDIGDADAFLVNPNRKQFFRVKYERADLMNLGRLADKCGGELTTADRFGLVSDVFALSKYGYIPAIDALDFVRMFNKEEDRIFLWTAVKGLDTIRSALVGERCADAVKKIECELVQHMLSVVGRDDKDSDTDEIQSVRFLVYGTASRCGDKNVTAHALEAFEKGENVSPNLRLPIFSAAATQGKSMVERLKSIFADTKSVHVQRSVLTALGLSPKEDIGGVLKMLKDGKVRHSDFVYVFAGLRSNEACPREAWEFVKKEWEWLSNLFEHSPNMLQRIVEYSARDFSTDADAKEVEMFYKDKDTVKINNAVNQTLERIRKSAAFRAKNAQQLNEALD